MDYIFKLPDIGEGIAEGEILQWFVKEGDIVTEDDVLLEVQNDKSVEEIYAPVEGTIRSIKTEAGTLASVGDPLVVIETDHLPHGEEATEEASTEEASANEPAGEAKEELAPQVPASKKTDDILNQPLAFPSVRRFAKENGVDLHLVTPTGKHNHILQSDVENFLENGSSTAEVSVAKETASTPVVEKAAPVAIAKGEDETREKMTPMRKAIAQSMKQSADNIPAVTLFDEVEVSALWEHRKVYKEYAAEQDVKLSFLPYIAKALAIVVEKYPELNASLDMVNEEVVYHHTCNVGIATNTDQGLYVPVLKDVKRKGLLALAKEISNNTSDALAGSLSAEAMRGGTITITNIGSIGGGFFTPIIRYPEVAILGIGKIKEAPIVKDGEIVVGKQLALSLSFDHRLIDGALAQNAMNELKRLLADPQLLLLEG